MRFNFMKITITQEDIDAALKEHSDDTGVTRCCVVFQALKRSGIPVSGVGYTSTDLRNGEIYALIGTDEITRASHEEWQNFLGAEIEFGQKLHPERHFYKPKRKTKIT